MRKPTSRKSLVLPSITLRSTYTSHFIHNGTVYPIAGSSSEVFKSAVLQLVGDHWDEKVLQAEDLDLVSRWYVLNRLVEKGKPMKLYTSRLEAERAVNALV